MADKYGFKRLMEECLRKIDVFPIGLRALETLEAHCGSLDAGLLDPCTSAKAGLLRLLDDAYDSHHSVHEVRRTTHPDT